MTELADLRREVAAFRPAAPDDEWAVLALEEAMVAGEEGNAAVGALIVDGDGQVLARGRNQLLRPRFRSDGHAEMLVVSAFEEERPDGNLRGCTLYTSLEPCDMCRVRLVTSGVSTVRYVAPAPDRDEGGPLAPKWQRLAATQTFEPARCSPRLREISLEAFGRTIGTVLDELVRRRGGPGGRDGD